MLLALLPLTLFAQFPGGTANDLCAHLAAETKQNIVVVKTTSTKVGAFDYDPADLDSISRGLRSKVKLELTPGVNVIGNDGRIPMSRLRVNTRDPYEAPKWVLPKIEANTITFATQSNESVDPAKLDEVKFSKPVKVHWFYDQVPVSINVKQMPEREFLTYLAKGIGARFLETPKEFRIDFEPSAMRNRIAKTIGIFKELWLKSPERNEEDSNALSTGRPDFFIGLLQDMSLGDITFAFATPESKVTVKVRSNGGAFRSGGGILDSYLKQVSKGQGFFRTPSGDFTLPLRIDASKPVTASLAANFKSSLRMTVIDANDKSIGELGFDFDGLEY